MRAGAGGSAPRRRSRCAPGWGRGCARRVGAIAGRVVAQARRAVHFTPTSSSSYRVTVGPTVPESLATTPRSVASGFLPPSSASGGRSRLRAALSTLAGGLPEAGAVPGAGSSPPVRGARRLCAGGKAWTTSSGGSSSGSARQGRRRPRRRSSAASTATTRTPPPPRRPVAAELRQLAQRRGHPAPRRDASKAVASGRPARRDSPTPTRITAVPTTPATAEQRAKAAPSRPPARGPSDESTGGLPPTGAAARRRRASRGVPRPMRSGAGRASSSSSHANVVGSSAPRPCSRYGEQHRNRSTPPGDGRPGRAWWRCRRQFRRSSQVGSERHREHADDDERHRGRRRRAPQLASGCLATRSQAVGRAGAPASVATALRADFNGVRAEARP